MSKEQIEEMAEVLRHSCENECFKNKDGFADCEACEACLLYDAGYRKQSEWISVEERLPTAEENDRGLVGIVNGHNGKIGFIDAIILVYYDFEERDWWSEDYNITNCKVEYWMPIPESPKMKGGAE